MVRTGIIGCGNIGRVHAEILKHMEQVEIRAFTDKDKERALCFASAYGTEDTNSYTSLFEMLDNEELDVLHICTPHFFHVPMAEEALAKKIHVFMEKPPAVSAEEFFSLKKAKEQSGKEVGICFQNRYNETTEKIFEILKTKSLGNLKGARAFVTWNRQAEYYETDDWRGKWATEGGGVLINQAIHTLDLLTCFFGKADQVEASLQNHHLKGLIEVEDTIEAYLTFPSGSVCFYATNAYVEDAPVYLELVCEKGKIKMEGESLEITGKNGERIRYDFAAQEPWEGKKYWGSSHKRCIQDFYDSIEQGRAYRNNLESTENTFLLTMKLYDFIKDKRNKMGGQCK